MKINQRQLIRHSSSERLFNDHLVTKDINKSWIIKNIPNYIPKIHIFFREQIKISMIRIWNMNTSRVITN